MHVKPRDYMRKVRVRRAANLILFLVDASWSMAVAERMTATKGAILSLLTDAYQRRDRVGLIVFQKDRATLVLPPTNSVQLASRALTNIPVGGKTPLAAGLQMAYEVLQREILLHPDVRPLLIILTDGAGNVSLGALPPLEEAYQVSSLIAKADIHSIVINMEAQTYDQGLSKSLAEKLKAPCLSLTDLKAEHLYLTVRHASNELQAEDEQTWPLILVQCIIRMFNFNKRITHFYAFRKASKDKKSPASALNENCKILFLSWWWLSLCLCHGVSRFRTYLPGSTSRMRWSSPHPPPLCRVHPRRCRLNICPNRTRPAES